MEAGGPGNKGGPGKGRRIVLGLGNILNRDEGVGVHCLEALRPYLPPDSGVEALDGGVLGLALLTLVESASHLLILDAVDASEAPGRVIELEGPDVPLRSRAKMSWHELGFEEVLLLAKARGRLPSRLHLIGVQPADLSMGNELSPAVRAAVPGVIARALAVLDEWRRS